MNKKIISAILVLFSIAQLMTVNLVFAETDKVSLEEGVCKIIAANNPMYCISISGTKNEFGGIDISKNEGSKAVLFYCLNNDDYRFKVEKVGDKYRFRTLHSNKLLTATKHGEQLVQKDENSSNEQLFDIVKNENGTVRILASDGNFIGVSGGGKKAGTGIILWEKATEGSQEFKFVVINNEIIDPSELPEGLNKVGLTVTSFPKKTLYEVGEAYKLGKINPNLPDPTLHYVPFTFIRNIILQPNFIADYNITHSFSQERLENFGLIDAERKETFQYQDMLHIRTITGGTYYPDDDKAFADNEWDSWKKYIKNWEDMYSVTSSKASDGEHITVRGFDSVDGADQVSVEDSNEETGWRPLLNGNLSELRTHNSEFKLFSVNLHLNGGSVDGQETIKLAVQSAYRAPSTIGLKPPAGVISLDDFRWSQSPDGRERSYKPGEILETFGNYDLYAQ